MNNLLQGLLKIILKGKADEYCLEMRIAFSNGTVKFQSQIQKASLHPKIPIKYHLY